MEELQPQTDHLFCLQFLDYALNASRSSLKTSVIMQNKYKINVININDLGKKHRKILPKLYVPWLYHYVIITYTLAIKTLEN